MHRNYDVTLKDVAKIDAVTGTASDTSPDAASSSAAFSYFEKYEEDWSSSIFLEGSSFLWDKEDGAEHLRKVGKQVYDFPDRVACPEEQLLNFATPVCTDILVQAEEKACLDGQDYSLPKHEPECLRNISESKNGISIVVTRNLLPLVARRKSDQAEQANVVHDRTGGESPVVNPTCIPNETFSLEKFSLKDSMNTSVRVVDKTGDIPDTNAAIIDVVSPTQVPFPSQIPSYNGVKSRAAKPPRPPRRSESWASNKPSVDTRTIDRHTKRFETRLTSPSCSQRLPRLIQNLPNFMRRNLTFTAKQASSASYSLSNSCADFLQLENSLNGQIDYQISTEANGQKLAKSKKDSTDFYFADQVSPDKIDKPRFSTPKTAIPMLRADKQFCTDLTAKISALNLNETTAGAIMSTQNSPKIHVKTTKAVVLRDQAIKKKHFPTDY